MKVFLSALNILAQSSDSGASTGTTLVTLCCWGIVAVILLASLWVIFTKANKPGYLGIIPIVNYWFLLEIVGRPTWWIILFFIPFVNIVVGFLVAIDLAKSFGKGTGFGCGLILLPIVFYPLLAFGDAKYEGPAAV